MLEVNLERLRTHQKNISRYRRLLGTHLTELERSYIERRVSEELASLKRILRDTFPERLHALTPRTQGQTKTLEVAAPSQPANAFAHPMDVVDDCDLTSYEKRAILFSWAADACSIEGPGRLVQESAVSFEDILDALQLVGSESEPAADNHKALVHYRRRNSPPSISVQTL